MQRFSLAQFFVFATLFLGIGLAATALVPSQPVVHAEANATDAVVAQLYLPLVGQGSSRRDDGETETPTPTATTPSTDPSTETPTSTPTSTPTTEPPPARHGLFALSDWLTYNAATAVDAQGGVHLAFYTSDERHQNEPRGQPAYYTYCPGPTPNCADPANWSTLVAMDDAVNEVQIVVTKTGQPRILVRRNGSRGNDYDFWACNQNCTDAQNWYGLRVTDAMGVELFNADMPQHSFALDSQERPRFVYGNGWGNGRPTAVYYAWCDETDCTEPGSWQQTIIYGPIEGRTITTDYATLVFDGDKPRVLTRLNLSGLPVSLDYYSCDANCDSGANWEAFTLSHPEGKMWANWDLALDANGRPHIALYEAAPIDITVGGKLFYAWCEADTCAGDEHWNLTQVASGEGKNVDLAIDAQGRMHMVYDAGQRGVIGHIWCDTNCKQANQWQRRILETSDQLQAEFPVDIPFTCNDQTEHAWLDAVPVVTFDKDRRLIVAYDTKHVATCYYQEPGRPDRIITRVERIWWAVRWAFFPQP